MFFVYKALKQTKAGPRSSGTPFLVSVKSEKMTITDTYITFMNTSKHYCLQDI